MPTRSDLSLTVAHSGEMKAGEGPPESEGIAPAPGAPSGNEYRRKSGYLNKEIKGAAPNEGAGHSQGERRLLVIRQRGSSAWIGEKRSLPGIPSLGLKSRLQILMS